MDWLGKNKRAIAPLRVSGYGQEHNTSRVTQKKDIEQYCKEKGLELADVIPIVETASKPELRKKYNEVIATALKQGIRHVIFHKYDREARNLTDNENNETLVRKDKFVLHYVADGQILHKNSPDSDFLNRDIHAAINKHYSRDLSTKVRRATKTKAESGWYPGTWTPFGYTHKKLKSGSGRDRRRGTVIVPDPNPKVVQQVRREFELRAQIPTPSIREIRSKIIEEGFILPDQVKGYHIGSIDRRLRSIFYDGRFEWQGEKYDGKHERIVSSELFWRVQETFGMRNPYGKRTGGLFDNGWIKCGMTACGCHVVYDPLKKTIKATGEQKTYKYYHCTNGKSLHPTLKGLRVTEEEIMEQFEPAVSQISIREDFKNELMGALAETQEKQRHASKREIENYTEALAVLHEKENRAYDHYDAGVIDRETYNHQRLRLQEEQRHFTKLMAQAQAKITDVANETVKTILQLATNAESLWKRRAPEERRHFLNRLLSNPVLDGVTVRYEIIKPLQTLSEMKQDLNWRKG